MPGVWLLISVFRPLTFHWCVVYRISRILSSHPATIQSNPLLAVFTCVQTDFVVGSVCALLQ
jgi:hypothetical protein